MNNGRIVILHNAVSDRPTLDEVDVLAQVEAVNTALRELGYETETIGLSLDMAPVADYLRRCQPRLVFNLVESVAGAGRLIHLAPALLDHLGLPFSGCPQDTVYLTSNKLLAKTFLRAAGLPTPPWAERRDAAALAALAGRCCIVKSVWEHASIGLDEEALLTPPDAAALGRRLQEKEERARQPFFAELFIDGREFNVSVLAGEVLPIPEMRFDGFPADKPKLVDYRAKWQEDSFEYRHTRRSFAVDAADRPLLDELARLSRRCWSEFGLKGYARVDFRVDTAGRPWILEINSNPCLTQGSGFAAAAAEAGLPFREVVRRIVADR